MDPPPFTSICTCGNTCGHTTRWSVQYISRLPPKFGSLLTLLACWQKLTDTYGPSSILNSTQSARDPDVQGSPRGHLSGFQGAPSSTWRTQVHPPRNSSDFPSWVTAAVHRATAHSGFKSVSPFVPLQAHSAHSCPEHSNIARPAAVLFWRSVILLAKESFSFTSWYSWVRTRWEAGLARTTQFCVRTTGSCNVFRNGASLHCDVDRATYATGAEPNQ